MAEFPTDLEIDAAFPDNVDGDITAAVMRTFQKDVSVAGNERLAPTDVVAGIGINVTDNGDGTITVSNTGGGGGGGGVPIAGEGITITDNGDDTYTIAMDSGAVLRPEDVTGTADQIIVTDGGDGTITLSIDPAFSPTVTVPVGTDFPPTPVDGELFMNVTEPAKGTYRWDEATQQWTLTQAWQPYTQSVGMIGRAIAGKSFSAGNIVALNAISPADDAAPVFSLWEQLTVDEIHPDASYDLPLTQEGSCRDSVNVNYARDNHQLPGAGTAQKYILTDLSGVYGTVNWSLTQLAIEGNNNTPQNSNFTFEIWGDLAGKPDPNNILVPYTEIDHTELHAIRSNNSNILYLNSSLPLTQGQTFWIVTLFNNRNQAVDPGACKPGCLGDFPVTPSEWTQGADYLTSPVEIATSQVTTDNGVSWFDHPSARILRTRVLLERTSSLEPPTNVYAMCLRDLDETTLGSLITYGPLTGDMSGTSVGETWQINDTLYWNPLTHGVTNTKPANSKDEIIVGTVFDNDPVTGTALVTLMMSGTRGILMSQSTYDPTGKRADAFNLNNFEGKTDAWRVRYDNGNGNTTATDVQMALDDALARIAALEP